MAVTRGDRLEAKQNARLFASMADKRQKPAS